MARSIRITHVPRSRDEEVLSWLRMRDQGMSISEIGRRCGISPYQKIAKVLRDIDDAEKDFE